jgi:predicted nucleotidyltransferase component of viral defense system
MIPQAFITAWRKTAPWTSNEQVEQDLLISKALLAIFSHRELSDKLAFRGGTALYKLHLTPAARYSEDIDLVQIEKGPIGPVLDQLRDAMNFLGEAKSDTAKNVATLTYKVDSEIQPVVGMKLKIEINGREHFAVQGWQKRGFQVGSEYCQGKCQITTYTLEELLATKLRALYQRRKGRDLFDLYYAAINLAKIDYQAIATIFEEYMQRSDVNVPSRSQYLANIETKLLHPDFIGDTTALLRPDIQFDYSQAYERIARDLLSCLKDSEL